MSPMRFGRGVGYGNPQIPYRRLPRPCISLYITHKMVTLPSPGRCLVCACLARWPHGNGSYYILPAGTPGKRKQRHVRAWHV